MEVGPHEGPSSGVRIGYYAGTMTLYSFLFFHCSFHMHSMKEGILLSTTAGMFFAASRLAFRPVPVVEDRQCRGRDTATDVFLRPFGLMPETNQLSLYS